MAAKPGTPPSSDDRPTDTIRWIGPYRVISVIKRGGQGVVYRALDNIGRDVAIKELLLSQLSPDEVPEARRRFVREAQAVGRLRHNNIVILHQFLPEPESLYLVMEFVPGGSLHDLIAGEIPLTTGDTLGIVRQVAAALDYAHSNGIVHRDIKPGNILVSSDPMSKRPVMKVTDFGIARISSQTMTMTGVSLGTPAYMAPEQIKATRTVDAKADQYSLGVVAYELLGRRLPFTASDPHGLMFQIVNSEPASVLEANPDLPPEVERVIRRALSKNPDRRFASCGAFADALEQALSPQAMPTVRTVRPKSGVGKWILAAIVALMAVAVALYFGSRGFDRPIAKAPTAPVVVSPPDKPKQPPDSEKAPDTSTAQTTMPAAGQEIHVPCVLAECKGDFVVNVELTTAKNQSRIAATLTNRTNQAIGSANFIITVKRHGLLKGIPGRNSRPIEFTTGPLIPGESSATQSFPRQGMFSEKWTDPTVPTAKFKPLPATTDAAPDKTTSTQ